jgi:predicted molibdopterin-dependent oxidoreductase YjgC
VVKGRTAQTHDSRDRDVIVAIGSKPRENHRIRTSTWYRVSRVQRLKESIFDCRSHEVPNTEGSCEHVAHPLGGDRVVDRWRNNKHPEKGGSG